MNHLRVSLWKSAFRIVACITLICTELGVAKCYFGKTEISGLVMFAALFGIAEILGILEEAVDKRKEN